MGEVTVPWRKEATHKPPMPGSPLYIRYMLHVRAAVEGALLSPVTSNYKPDPSRPLAAIMEQVLTLRGWASTSAFYPPIACRDGGTFPFTGSLFMWPSAIYQVPRGNTPAL